MGIHKESSLNLWVNLKFLVNTHKTSTSKIFCDSIAKSGFNDPKLAQMTKTL